MGTTPIYALRFRELSETPDIPAATQNLALDVEDELVRVDGVFTQRTPAGATVATLETRILTTYGDLTTVGPAVTVTTGTSAVVHLSCAMFNSSGVTAAMSFAVSGATTQSASDTKAIIIQNASLHRYGITVLVTGLTPGSNTFTAKFRVVSGTGSFQDRHLVVVPV